MDLGALAEEAPLVRVVETGLPRAVLTGRQGRIDHLLPDLPGELVPIYSQLIEADVPEVLTRQLMRHVSETLEPDQFHQAESIRAALCEAETSKCRTGP